MEGVGILIIGSYTVITKGTRRWKKGVRGMYGGMTVSGVEGMTRRNREGEGINVYIRWCIWRQ